jgi:hypothetical protein
MNNHKIVTTQHLNNNEVMTATSSSNISNKMNNKKQTIKNIKRINDDKRENIL